MLVHRAREQRIPRQAIPLAYCVAAVVLGQLLPRIENRWLADLVHPMSVAAAVAIHSSVASGMIALTGVVFALAFVMVQFGAVAYSPRLVSWISRDPLIMHAIGIFTATFLYALAAMAWVDRLGSGRVPFLSTAMVIGLLLASIAVFVGLVQRLSLLQVNSILLFAAERGRRLIDQLYPPLDTASVPPDALFEGLTVTQVLVHHDRPRTIQALDTSALIVAACDADGIIEAVSAVGDTVGEGMVLLRVYGASTHIAERELMDAIVLGNERTFEQDPKYAIHLLTDIAIRALSPAINDPSTAVQVLDQIEDLLLRLGRRRLETGQFYDREGNLRFVMPFPTWDDFLTLALEQIRYYGASSVPVMRRMRALIGDLIEGLPGERRPSLRREQERLDAIIMRSFEDDEDVVLASVEDRQGLGAPRRRRKAS